MFRKRLKELRIEKNLSQLQLAEFLGVKKYNICDWEVGRSEPNAEMIIKIADYFGVTTDYLLGRTDY